jgi:hypothetical protein
MPVSYAKTVNSTCIKYVYSIEIHVLFYYCVCQNHRQP